jgi:NADH:ubiquinone oxidoreductase subunit 3 (subunit A)
VSACVSRAQTHRIAHEGRAPTGTDPRAEFEDSVDQNQLGPLWYVVGFVIAGTLFVFGTIGLAWLISHRTRGDEHKGYPYESGIDTFGDSHARFGISFYIYALMFVAFDIEVVFIFLWALIFQTLTNDLLLTAFTSMLIFVAILMLGLAYAWRKGVLSWR